ncbi:MAG: GTPase ObgE [Deltaproteobacteria bacterium]
MKFIDEARVRVAAGDGGDGCMAFLREKFRPHGGPAGGDGGSGGSIVGVADQGLTTLLDLSYRRVLKAKRGEDGRGKSQHGKAADDLVVRLPVGTVVTETDGGRVVADLTDPGQRTVLARGGRGGLGNARFATSTHQSPRRADPGGNGQQRELTFELRLLADAGLVGLPNAGKSSLLARVTAAKPKIADYPFTTLTPCLGVVDAGEHDSFVLADIPGLIEGAHLGHGLGLRFLRHLSRTAVLVHLVDISDKSPEQAVVDFDVVNAELANHSAGLAAKSQLVVASKCDLPDTREKLEALRRLLGPRNIEILEVSSATGNGCSQLMRAIHTTVIRDREERDGRLAEDCD